MQYIKDRDYMHMLERLLKMSIPTVYFWILMFVANFHLFLNITSELLLFADRQFYKVFTIKFNFRIGGTLKILMNSGDCGTFLFTIGS